MIPAPEPVKFAPGRTFVDLADVTAADRTLTGGKAAALARAAAAGLPTLPGVVLTTAFSAEIDRGAPVEGHPALRACLDRLDGERRPLVVRSSSVAEDTEESSAAGQFATVVGVTGLEELIRAVTTVLGSRARAGADGEAIAVLVQPELRPVLGGVCFGVDPVLGRTDRRVIEVAEGGPGPLVSGETTGQRIVTDPEGSLIEGPKRRPLLLDRRAWGDLLQLDARTNELFGGPQDIEWAIDDEGRLWLLQSRPVTTEIRGVPGGPLYGTGPVAETFPEPLSALERSIWVPALDDGIREALRLAGSPTDAAPLVVVCDGRVAVDLDRTGAVESARSRWSRFNPVAVLRRLRSAWRIGRLRAALPALAERLLARVDDDLESLPALAELSDRQLVGLIGRGRSALRSVHAHEILMGMLTDARDTRLSGASVAIRLLAEGRAEGLDDADIVAESPIVLALSPPSVGPAVVLPARVPELVRGSWPADGAGIGSDNGLRREALRIRVRWLHEVTGRAAWILAERLVDAGRLPRAGNVHALSLEDLGAVTTGRADVVPAAVDAATDADRDPGDPLPPRFRLSDLGRPIAARPARGGAEGTGAGGGAVTGTVTHDPEHADRDSILVVPTLDPGLGPRLGSIGGVVCESGGVLSHLAILAREVGVPMVVGYRGAVTELSEGTTVRIDGGTGAVEVVGETAGTASPAEARR